VARAWKIVGDDHKSLSIGGKADDGHHPCGDMVAVVLAGEGIDVPAEARKQLSYGVGETVDGGPMGIFAYDSRHHPQITNGAWRLDERFADARLVELGYHPDDLVKRDCPRAGHVLIAKARVISSEPLELSERVARQPQRRK
jgi:hypothetical protein